MRTYYVKILPGRLPDGCAKLGGSALAILSTCSARLAELDLLFFVAARFAFGLWVTPRNIPFFPFGLTLFALENVKAPLEAQRV